MRIERIEVKGWMPFGEALELSLPAGPIGVVGMHGEDARRSNRAGKTSLLEAITWALFGTHRKRLEDQIIHRRSDACSVTVRLGRLSITRSRSRGSSTKLEVRNESNTVLTGAAAQTAISDSLGLSLDDYTATACFPQGDVEAIIARSASERLALVSDWLQQGRWIEARAVQTKKASAAIGRLNEASAAAEVARSYLLSADERLAIGAEIVNLDATVEALEANVAVTAKRIEEAQLSKHVELSSLRERASQLRPHLKARGSTEREKAERVEREVEARRLRDIAKAEYATTDNVRRTGFDGMCPVMCAACPATDLVTETVRDASELHKQRSQNFEAADRAWSSASTQLATVSHRAAEFDRTAARYQELIERGKQLASELTMTEEQARALAGDPSVLDDFRARLAEALARRTQLVTRLHANATNEDRYRLLLERVESTSRAAQVSQLAQRAIAAIPARIAAQQLGELEREANVLLEGTGVSIRFSLWRELADWAPTCEACGHAFESKRAGRNCSVCSAPREKKRAQELEILCDDGSGGEEDVRYNSGGTRAIVGSAIRLAASAMLRRLRSSQAAWAIVDEPFSALDAENREQLARTFAGMLSSVGLEQALVVSHDEQLLAALPNRIVVTKDGVTSTARLE